MDKWDQIYKQLEYVYGTEPNGFLKEMLEKYSVKGKILIPGDGEGRNGVYAATTGLDVYSFDLSREGQKKALRLAEQTGVHISYQVGDFMELNYEGKSFDAAALIFAHFTKEEKQKYFKKIEKLLKKEGLIFMEVFSQNNLKLREKGIGKGGPDQMERLYDKSFFREILSSFEILTLEEKEVNLTEGPTHAGLSKVIHLVARKK